MVSTRGLAWIPTEWKTNVGIQASSIAASYSAAFMRQINRLRRRYRRIRQELQPIIEHRAAGERPRDQIRALSHTPYKLRVRNTRPSLFFPLLRESHFFSSLSLRERVG